jgi:hypothetical protein
MIQGSMRTSKRNNKKASALAEAYVSIGSIKLRRRSIEYGSAKRTSGAIGAEMLAIHRLHADHLPNAPFCKRRKNGFPKISRRLFLVKPLFYRCFAPTKVIAPGSREQARHSGKAIAKVSAFLRR